MAARAREIPTLEELRITLNDLALADARHDFNGDRGNFVFSNAFKDYKNIGTPIVPDASIKIPHEWQTLNTVLRLTDLTKNDDECKLAFMRQFPLGAEPVSLSLYQGDTQPYIITGRIVAKKERDQRTWYMKGASLYKFMNNDSENFTDLTITIDAASVPIEEGLNIKDETRADKGDKSCIINYVLSREGIIDGADKASLSSNVAGSQIRINKIYDNAEYKVAYPATDIRLIGVLHFNELFFSKYPIHIPEIKLVNGIRSTSIQFTNVLDTVKKESFKSPMENINKNTVNNLSTFLSTLFTLISQLAGKTGNSIPEREYHMGLQSKRAGDWLQVLACLTPERFGLDSKRRIRIITHDIICLSYALKMGVDVIFTKVEGGEYSLYRFFKQEDPEDPLISCLKEISSLDGLDIDFLNLERYKSIYNETEEKLKGEAFAILENERAVIEKCVLGDDSKLQNSMRKIIRAGVKLVSFRTSCSNLNEIVPANGYIYDVLNKDEIKLAVAANNLIDVLNEIQKISKFRRLEKDDIINKIKHDTNIFRTSSMAIARVLQTGKTIEKYFNSYLTENTALKNRYMIVDKLAFRMRGIFSQENNNENGLGIFSYMNKHLKHAELKLMFELLNKIKPKVSKMYQDNYNIIIQTASVLTSMGGALAPGSDKVSNKEILDAMLGEDGDVLERGVVNEEAEPEGKRLEDLADDFRRIEEEEEEILKDIEIPDEEEPATASGASGASGAAPKPKTKKREKVAAYMLEVRRSPRLKRGGSGDSRIEIEGLAIKTIEISDFFTENVILAGRAQIHFGIWGEGIVGFNVDAEIDRRLDAAKAAMDNEEAIASPSRNASKVVKGEKKKGGAYSSDRNHCPLTTVALILSMIRYKVNQGYYDEYICCSLLSFIVRIISEDIPYNNTEAFYKKYYSIEAYLLEKLAIDYPNRGFENFMSGIKENFYGIYTVDYEKFIDDTLDHKKYMSVIILKKEEILKITQEAIIKTLYIIGEIENKRNTCRGNSCRIGVKVDAVPFRSGIKAGGKTRIMKRKKRNGSPRRMTLRKTRRHR